MQICKISISWYQRLYIFYYYQDILDLHPRYTICLHGNIHPKNNTKNFVITLDKFATGLHETLLHAVETAIIKVLQRHQQQQSVQGPINLVMTISRMMTWLRTYSWMKTRKTSIIEIVSPFQMIINSIDVKFRLRIDNGIQNFKLRFMSSPVIWAHRNFWTG